MKKILLLCLCWITASQAFAQLPPNTGLHYTPDELTAWRARADRGPYKAPGDAGVNSPAEWNRLVTSANKFYANPAAELWRPYPKVIGCVAPEDANTPEGKGHNLRDAAFIYLLRGGDHLAAAVRTAILAQIDVKATASENLAQIKLCDFTNTARWCPTELKDLSPTFYMAAFLTRLLYAYDYTKGYAGYTTADKAKIEAWFLAGANFLNNEAEYHLNRIFVNRPAGNYTFSGYGAAYANNGTEQAYYGGPFVPKVTYYFNNRRCMTYQFSALVGVFTNNTALKTSAARYFKDYFRFSTFPNGIPGEMERGNEGKPETGWQYSWDCINAMCTIADAFGRIGDTTLFAYTTSAGLFDMAGGNKGLKNSLLGMTSFQNGFNAYCTYNPANQTDAYLINGWDPINKWDYVMDSWASVANRYYRDLTITRRYKRALPGMRKWPVTPRGSGSSNGWTGGFGTMPSYIFMFGDMENSASNNYLPAPPTSYNVARFHLASLDVSSTFSNYRKENAVVGDSIRLLSRWVSEKTPGPDSITLNFSQPVRLDTTYILTGIPVTDKVTGKTLRYAAANHLTVEIYNAGAWSTIYTTTTNTLSVLPVVVNVPTCTRLRIVDSSFSPDYLQYTRLKVYPIGKGL